MNVKTEEHSEAKVVWKEESRTLTLVGEPVLTMTLSWPECEGKGPLAKCIKSHYGRLAQCWRRRWEREGYLQACCKLAQQREQSRPFVPWSACLGGRVTLDKEEYLSISMWANEVRGDGRRLEYRWGDTWRKEDGAPVTLKELYAGERRWRRRLRDELAKAAEESRRQGVFLDRGAEKQLGRWLSGERFALFPEGLEVYFPQCTIAPAVEGATVLRVSSPRRNGGREKGSMTL